MDFWVFKIVTSANGAIKESIDHNNLNSMKFLSLAFHEDARSVYSIKEYIWNYSIKFVVLLTPLR